MTFDESWEQAERQALLQRLQREYPVWQRRRKQRIAVACTVAVLAATGITLSSLHSPLSSLQYDGVCCNRSGIAESHWAEVAANILTAEVL